ncbi:MAG TPA: hypothetical protein VG476_13965, partial [Acidimicrobiales bacterium]|nr:hypothetical protein [Acidimicrobiales bacterium]
RRPGAPPSGRSPGPAAPSGRSPGLAAPSGRSPGPAVPVGGVLVAVARRPRLWPTAAIEVARLARPGWWRRWPPVPLPDPAYLAFRLETAYGDTRADHVADDVVEYLAWCREARLAAR